MFTTVDIILAFVCIIMVVGVILQLVYIRVELSKYALMDHSKQAMANTRAHDIYDRQNNFNLFAVQVDLYMTTVVNNGDLIHTMQKDLTIPELPISIRIFDNPINMSITPENIYFLALKKSESSIELFTAVLNQKINFMIIAGRVYNVSIMPGLQEFLMKYDTDENFHSKLLDCVILYIPFPLTYEKMLPTEYKGYVSGGQLITSFFGQTTEMLYNPKNENKPPIQRDIESNQILHIVGYRV
jgi:hypothetical protein